MCLETAGRGGNKVSINNVDKNVYPLLKHQAHLHHCNTV